MILFSLFSVKGFKGYCLMAAVMFLFGFGLNVCARVGADALLYLDLVQREGGGSSHVVTV